MTDDEKKTMMDDMDKAAVVAEQEFKAMSQHITVPMARWWLQHYGKAGHKRLGRMMVQHAKAMEKTNPTQWADADEKKD